MENTKNIFFGFIALRYFVITGIAFFIFYLIFKKNFNQIKIQKVFPKLKDYYREIKYSLLTTIVFMGYAYLIFRTPFRNYTQIYSDISEHSTSYFVASIILALVIHDTYFYWTHRLMHHPKLFKWFHLVHHQSTNPTPFTSYSFHPLEAIVEGGVIVVITVIMPIHPYATILFMTFMLLYNVYGHLGYEIFPNWVIRSKIGKWLNTSTYHNMHHKHFNGNYGLYFRFWDKLLYTIHPDYERTIKELKFPEK
ncbi:MAG: sterol desaturase family protein [Vicingaceae bacterium]|nr:sterol desaturase family protein [Vicingaceae bacterium]